MTFNSALLRPRMGGKRSSEQGVRNLTHQIEAFVERMEQFDERIASLELWVRLAEVRINTPPLPRKRKPGRPRKIQDGANSPEGADA